MIFLQIGLISFLFSSAVAPVGRSTTGVMLGSYRSPGVFGPFPICKPSDSEVTIDGASSQIFIANFFFRFIALTKDGFLDICRITLNKDVEYAASISSSNPHVVVSTNETDRWALRFKETRANGKYCDGEDLFTSQVIAFRAGIFFDNEAGDGLSDNPNPNPEHTQARASLGDLMDQCADALLGIRSPDMYQDPDTYDSETISIPPSNPSPIPIPPSNPSPIPNPLSNPSPIPIPPPDLVNSPRNGRKQERKFKKGK